MPGPSNRQARQACLEDQRHLGGPKNLIAEEAKGTKYMPEDMLPALFIE